MSIRILCYLTTVCGLIQGRYKIKNNYSHYAYICIIHLHLPATTYQTRETEKSLQSPLKWSRVRDDLNKYICKTNVTIIQWNSLKMSLKHLIYFT